MAEQADTGRDSTRIFLGLMAVLVVLAGIWSAYTWKQIRLYQKARENGVMELAQMRDLDRKLRAMKPGAVIPPSQIVPFLSFKNVVQPPKPAHEDSREVGDYRETTYTVAFPHLTRQQALIYVYNAQQRVLAITLKEVTMEEVPGRSLRPRPPDPEGDVWKWKLVFASREKLKP